MKIIKKAVVKHILTTAKRQEWLGQSEDDIKRIEREIEQLRFQLQKQLKSLEHSARKSEVKQRFDSEIRKRKERIRTEKFRQNQLQQLPEGSEIVGEKLDTISEVKVGDDWQTVMADQEIIIKDGQVIEIRRRSENGDDELV